MILDLPADLLERAVTAFDCASQTAPTALISDQATTDAATIRKAIDTARHAAQFQSMFDEGDDA